MDNQNIRLTWSCRRITPSKLQDFGRQAGLALPEAIDMSRFLGPGVACVSAWSGGTLVGMARAFNDTVYTTWLAELCALPAWKEAGIEQMLLDKINKRFRRFCLYCSPQAEAVEFFRGNGIKPREMLVSCHGGPFAPVAADEPGEISITTDPSRYGPADFDRVLDTALAIPPSNTDDETYSRLFGEGAFGFFAETADNQLVGLLRILSDDVTKTSVSEICIHPDFQRRGIGTALLRRAIARFSHTAIWTECFPRAVPVFRKCGIDPDPRHVGCSRASLR